MSSTDEKLHSTPRRAAADASLARLARTLDGFFPAGTPIPGATFLDGVASAIDGDQAALVLVRMSKKHRVLRVVDDLLRKAPTHHARSFTEKVNDHAAWTKDPVARRLHSRCRRRPEAHFAYSTRRLARNGEMHQSFSIALLDGMGAHHEITSLLPVAEGLFSLLTVYRMSPASRSFSRSDRRLLKVLHRTFAPRVIDLRLAAIRESLPESLRATFALLLAGHTEKEIATATHRSQNTIHDHVKRVYQIFNVTSRPQLMARFIDLDRVLRTMPQSEGLNPLSPGEG